MRTTTNTIVTLALLISATFGAASNAAAQQQVNIKTLFWMLPADAFPDYVPQDDKEGKESHISVCDYRNGYLALGGGEFIWEMCYWNLKDGRKLVAVNQNFETGPDLRFFYYENGKLREDTDYNIWENISIQLEDFIDVSQLKPGIIAEVRENVEGLKYTFYYQLPQKGTFLKVLIDHEALMEDFETVSYEACKELTIKWVNEKWIK